jgi:hypothetical protein
MSRKDIYKDGVNTQFSSTNQPETKGRKKKLISTICEDLRSEGFENASPANIKNLYEQFLNLTEEKLRQLFADSEQPILVKILVKSILSDRAYEVVESIIDRAHGKASQNIDHTTKGEAIKQVFKIGDTEIEL